MGNRESQLTKQELQDYKELTYLTTREILHAFSRWKALSPDLLNVDKHARIPFRVVKRIPELQNNPWADRIGEVFSSEGDGCWSFEDFLDMVSVFSEHAPLKTKIEYAFSIYDFDGDGLLSAEDLAMMIKKLIGSANRLKDDEITAIIEEIMKEADLDTNGTLSHAEFEHFLSKFPDFASSFTIRM